MSSKHVFLIGIGAAAIAAALFFFVTTQQPQGIQLAPTAVIDIGGVPLHVAIADDGAERQQGLSGVSGLANDEGMLFIFPSDSQYSFWMKDMLFSIDMLWIAADGTVVFVAPSVSPDTYPQSFTPALPARYVLEVQAGFALEHEIGVGSKLAFSL